MAGTILPISNNNSYNLLNTCWVPSTYVKCFLHVNRCKPHKSFWRSCYYLQLPEEKFQAQRSWVTCPRLHRESVPKAIFHPQLPNVKLHGLPCYPAFVLKELYSSLRVWKSNCPLRVKFKNQVSWAELSKHNTVICKQPGKILLTHLKKVAYM